jgi:hypothetical protein
VRKTKIVFALSVGLALAVLPARVSLAQTAQEVIVPNGASGVDTVAVSGTSAIVGSPDASPPSVSFLSQSEGTWSVAQTIKAPDIATFGFSVAMSGTLAAVGSPKLNDKGGSVGIYSDTSGTWKKVFTAKASTGEFGYSLASSNGVFVVGSPSATEGYLYVIQDVSGTWTSTKLAHPVHAKNVPKAAVVGLGTDVGVSMTTTSNDVSWILTSSPGTDGSGGVTDYFAGINEPFNLSEFIPESDVDGIAQGESDAEMIGTAGVVGVYNTGDFVQTLSPPAPETGCEFGAKLSLAQDAGGAGEDGLAVLLVSDPAATAGCPHPSTVYLFTGNTAANSPTWAAAGSITATDSAHPFGSTAVPVSTDGATGMVGAEGAVYLQPAR